MADKTGIEWTDATVNFWWGCTKVGPGCDHCYAETHSNRFTPGHWGTGAPRRKIKSAVALLHKLDNAYAEWAADSSCLIENAKAFGRPVPAFGITRRVFIQSMSDLFDLEVPLEWFAEAWGTIYMCRRINVQIVTKRISAVEKRLAAIGYEGWPKHVGLMVTVCNQDEFDRDVPRLRALKARRGIPWVGLSIEPMLGQIVMPPEWLADVDWIIVGGESGPGARPMHPDWARSIRDQCATAGVAFLFKQWGEFREFDTGPPPHVEVDNESETADAYLAAATNSSWITSDGRHITRRDSFPADELCRLIERLGKKRAGRLLDGVTHDGYPRALA